MTTLDVLAVFRDSSVARLVGAGDVIFRQGDAGDVMYVVIEGQVDVSAMGSHVESLGPGSLLGEMAIVSDMPRSATATAATDCVIVPVDQQWFRYLVRQTPSFGIHVMSVLAARLRRYMEAQHPPAGGSTPDRPHPGS